MSVLLPLDDNLFLTQTLVIFLLHAKQLGNSILVISLWGVIFLYLRWFCYSYAWSCNLWKLWRFLFMFPTAFLHLLSWFIFLYQSPSSSLCNDFHAISSKINKVLSISRSANVFVFGDFNKVYHKDWLTYSCGTGRPNELCYNFSRKTFLRWLTFILGWIYFSFDLSNSSTVAFSLSEKFDHVVVLAPIDFPWNAKRDAPPFSITAYDYSCADWDDLRDYLRYDPCKDILVLLWLLLDFVSGSRLEIMYIFLIVNIRFSFIYHHVFQVFLVLP